MTIYNITFGHFFKDDKGENVKEVTQLGNWASVLATAKTVAHSGLRKQILGLGRVSEERPATQPLRQHQVATHAAIAGTYQ